MDSNHLTSILFIGTITAGVVFVVIALLNYDLKRKMIRAGSFDERVFSRSITQLKISAIKWALLFSFGGAGLMVLEYIPYSFETSPFPYGFEAFLLAIALFLYYLIIKKEKE